MAQLNEIIIKPGMGAAHYWRELWRYRELFLFLAWRDILVRYKQTVIGIAWSVIRPLLTMVVFTVVFGKLAKLPANGVPYPVLVYAALLPWQFFANALSESSNSLIDNSNLLAKVYFPRVILPASAVTVCLVDFLISCILLAGLMLWYRVVPGWEIVLIPVFLGLALLASLGAGLWLAALNVKYRDFRYVVPFVVQVGLYVSPVGFSTAIVPERWRLLYFLNPMVGVIDGFRWALLGDAYQVHWSGMCAGAVMAVILMVFGLWYFRRTERGFADVV
ncbi:transport permease protein [Geomonas silvestris]|uniref:Transport permease protein n=1 Tax=Geomonas silvestris TaxID=2740184 RepID=A0A6V8MD71_9BACT|nr:ABC transporter permease [Geomonas silvestris]GFO57948.1 transport permease protein [Geomonas silvestris]